jgi:imidazolonepropionase-like amidohydrolase
MLTAAWPVRRRTTGETGTSLPAFTDHHVHAHLVDMHALPARGIARVLDLGGDPADLARRPSGLPRMAYAGAFLTTPGGYPRGRAWAPDAIVCDVSNASPHPGVPGGARTAVDAQADAGASVIKVAMNADACPVPSDEVLAAVVAAARERGLPVVAHAQGVDQVERAIEAGVAALAHTPFGPSLSRRLLTYAADAGQVWISTLDIHRGDARARAVAHLGAFAERGGRVLYGTDLGNGPLPLGVNRREILALQEAGIRGDALVASLTDPWPAPTDADGVCSFIAGPAPTDLDDLATWLSHSVAVPAEELTRVD